MQIVWPDDVAKRLSQPMQEIEDQILFDLNRLIRTLQPANPPALTLIGDQPAEQRDDKQPEKE